MKIQGEIPEKEAAEPAETAEQKTVAETGKSNTMVYIIAAAAVPLACCCIEKEKRLIGWYCNLSYTKRNRSVIGYREVPFV